MNALLLTVYQLLATIASLASAPYLIWRSIRHRAEMAERLGFQGASRADAGTGRERPLWIHAASLGELESARALWDTPGRGPTGPLLLTVTSVSARKRAVAIAPAGTRVRYAPLDLWFAVEPFLRRERPRALVLLETELWPWTLHACHGRGIPAVLVSGRLSPRKWGRTRLAAPLLRGAVRSLALTGAQSAVDAVRLRVLGAEAVEVTGNLKYRLAGDPTPVASTDSHFVFVAGSVRSGEEAVLAAAHLPGVLCVLAPRHLREREHWTAACAQRGVPWIGRSALALAVPAEAEWRDPGRRSALRAELAVSLPEDAGGRRPALLLDRHGELGAWYAVADAAFVGGSLVPIGGHNLFEPARLGVPVAFGPHTAGVEDVAEQLLRLGGGVRVGDGGELVAWLERMRTARADLARASLGAAEAARFLAAGAGRTLDLLHRFDWFAAAGGEQASTRARGSS